MEYGVGTKQLFYITVIMDSSLVQWFFCDDVLLNVYFTLLRKVINLKMTHN